jgi:hypothetical protein
LGADVTHVNARNETVLHTALKHAAYSHFHGADMLPQSMRTGVSGMFHSI